MAASTPICVRTQPHYRGQPVTLIGHVGGELLAVAAFSTLQETIVGATSWTGDMEKAAADAVAIREGRDAGAGCSGDRRK